jgi:AmmeMemoRadiSam system protein A
MKPETSDENFASDLSPQSSIVSAERSVLEGNDDELLPALARRAVETFVLERGVFVPETYPETSILTRKSACFVSIKTAQRDLRGCIGNVAPVKPTLAEEIVTNAINAATRDPRFFPVIAEELPHLRYSVDVLFEPEPARLEDLNPAIFGVIVEDETMRRRGLLLPDIDGIETAAQQVQIAARKAGIAPEAPLKLHRFRVRRFRESV